MVRCSSFHEPSASGACRGRHRVPASRFPTCLPSRPDSIMAKNHGCIVAGAPSRTDRKMVASKHTLQSVPASGAPWSVWLAANGAARLKARAARAKSGHSRHMSVKRRWGGGLLAIIGFMLSPLSWWNDLFVNVPLAVGFGWLIGLIHEPAFRPAVIVGYWLTNVLGFVLLHKGARQALVADVPKPYSRRDLLK